MYPTKSILDYMTEMNRLFPRSDEDKLPSPPTVSHQFYNHSSMAPSSSSADTSPDSFPDMTAHRFPSDTFQHLYEGHFDKPERFEGPYNYDNKRDPQYKPHQYENQRMDQLNSNFRPVDQDMAIMSQQIYETPFTVRRQRPIVGRKIIAAPEAQTKVDVVSKVWNDDSLALPTGCIEQKYNPNTFYELFPSENKGIEFKTPVKTSPNSFTMSPNMLNVSPRMPVSARMANVSPSLTNMSSRMPEMSHSSMNMPPRMANMSPRMKEMSPSSKTSPGSSASQYSPQFLFKEPFVGTSTSFGQNVGPPKMCTFCRKNGETPLVYMTHTVKEKVGNKNVVTCPILRSHICSTCGASGDNAHTITYCPVLRSGNNGQPLQSTTITLKNTRVKSNGRRRY